ncbi:MAG TPA: peptidoglycan DD-metalloendopeptidase family protein [Candidatus Paceibacterota bacterium]
MIYFRIFFIFFIFTSTVHAQTADELRGKIGERSQAIQQLEKEIAQYQKDIAALGKEKDTLSNAIKSLDLSKKKLEADIKVTENKIASRNLEIKELSLQIGDKSERIDDGKVVISQSLYKIAQFNSASVIEAMLGKDSFSDLWASADELATLQGGMQNKIKELESLKVSLEDNKRKTEKKKTELIELTNDLRNQKKIIEGTTMEKNSILKQTKNTEANYNKLLADRKAQRIAFEKEISELEKALKIVIDPSSIPIAGSGVLRWPLDNVRITQYFGNTAFATQNPQVYKGTSGEHNGIDLGAAIGTQVRAAASGVVTNVITTNIIQGCGYGKWIMIKHPTGISTLYAHLSLPSVSVGDVVATGQTIGYSGNTGYATGPHLHFGVYVTQAFQTKASVSCPGVIIPYAPLNGYLNPLSYL